MVCKKCEQKLGRVVCPDTWKQGSRNTMESGGRRLGENKLLSSAKKSSFKPRKGCTTCGQPVHQEMATMCHACAYAEGICSICGDKILDTSMYRMSGGAHVVHNPRSTPSDPTNEEEPSGKRKHNAEETEDRERSTGTDRDAKKSRSTMEAKVSGWKLDESTGYYYDKATKYFFDPKTKLYFHHSTGKWTKRGGGKKKEQT